MKPRIVVSVFLLLWLPVIALADLRITVESDIRWGNAPTSNIKALCENVALHFQEQVTTQYKVRGKVNVRWDGSGPFIRFASWDPPDTFNIYLSVTDTRWQQMAYQFAHEFCHALMGDLERLRDRKNLWFEETICMLSSIWVLKEMTETWAHRAPYPNWAGWRHLLTNYANQNMNAARSRYTGTATEWLLEHEDFLRSKYMDFTEHGLVTQLAYNFLLPIFEKNPKGWNAVAQLPDSDSQITEYMKEWYQKVDIEDKRFVEAIAKEMGIEIAPVATEINSFAEYVNLTFTHGDDNSITPSNKPSEWNGYPPRSIDEKRPNGMITNGTGDKFDEMHQLSHWVYSHAPATIVYDISDINYTSFGAYFLLPHPYCGGAASMEFIAKADNVKLYSEEFYLPDYGEYIEFEIPPGTQMLNLTIGDLGNQGCDHFVLGEPRLYQSNIVASKEITDMNADVNNDGYVDLSDVLIVRSAIQNSVSYDTDVNGDGETDEVDVLIVKAKAHAAIVAAAPSFRKRKKITAWGALKRK